MTLLKDKDTISEKLDGLSLPQLPQVLVQLIDICNSEEVDIRLVAQTVAQDIAITTKTLKLANSAFLGARSQFKNIDQAVIFLGVDTVRNLAISVSVHEVFGNNKKLKGFQTEQFWYHSLLTALISKTIAQKSGYDDPGAAYLAGLLHDTGKYILAQHFGEPYIQLLQKYFHETLIREEQKTFDISHPEVGHWLLSNWNIDDELALAIRDHHNDDGPDTETSILGRILRLANTLIRKSGPLDDQSVKDTSILCITPSSLPDIVEEQTNNLDDLAQTLGIRIEAPEPVEAETPAKTDKLEQLNDKIEIRARLYGFMDNIIQAKTVNRVFLALEESLSLLFNCQQNVLLLPQSTGEHYSFQGSFRNRAAKQLKVEGEVLSRTTAIRDAEGNRTTLSELGLPTMFSRSDNATELARIFDALQHEKLLALPLRVSRDHQGLLLLALSSEKDPVVSQQEMLQLLSSHVGNRLFLETIKEEYAQTYAQERVAAVEEIARSVAHEISTPLGVIQNYITLIAEKEGLVDQENSELTLISRELERIGSITKGLSDLSKPPGERNYRALDVNNTVLDVISLYQHSANDGKNITIEFNPVADLPLIWIEENPLRQILGNLLSNSIDAVGQQGDIEILCHHIPGVGLKQSGEIVIVVSDNGPGVPPSIANTIFRAGTTTKSDGHAGLGLAIVNKLTKQLSGRVYHSTGKLGNTQFTLHLPVTKQPGT